MHAKTPLHRQACDKSDKQTIWSVSKPHQLLFYDHILPNVGLAQAHHTLIYFIFDAHVQHIHYSFTPVGMTIITK